MSKKMFYVWFRATWRVAKAVHCVRQKTLQKQSHAIVSTPTSEVYHERLLSRVSRIERDNYTVSTTGGREMDGIGIKCITCIRV